ncbi:hypothetical protein BKA70DRAFT_784976 [Coprinopsis sp. MPI-PUGE-AT-0042]|nr:hypothetical protein BKA70DRAFT_784976 [Coprinopsis sp. MPI-PUGE-AT-0042]
MDWRRGSVLRPCLVLFAGDSTSPFQLTPVVLEKTAVSKPSMTPWTVEYFWPFRDHCKQNLSTWEKLPLATLFSHIKLKPLREGRHSTICESSDRLKAPHIPGLREHVRQQDNHNELGSCRHHHDSITPPTPLCSMPMVFDQRHPVHCSHKVQRLSGPYALVIGIVRSLRHSGRRSLRSWRCRLHIAE